MLKYQLILGIYLTACTLTAKCNPGTLFPRIKGWEAVIDKTVYGRLNLWEYINGAADLYLSYDFENLYMAEYSNNKGQAVKVEIYRQSSAENAFGIYTAERMADYNFVDIGIQGYVEPDALNFLSGEYYVKMMSSGMTGVEQAALLTIAKEINSALDRDKKWPDVIKLFPAEGKIANSENYIARDFLGYSFFHSAYTAKYDAKEKFRIFIIKLESQTDAESMLESYTSLINEDKITRKGNIYIINDFFNGMVILSVKNNYIIGIINTENVDLGVVYLNKTKARLVSSLNLE
jgi:hypothetical protein